MKIILAESLLSADYLKYGLNGLIALVLIILFLLIRKNVDAEKGKNQLYVFVGVLLILLSAATLLAYNRDKIDGQNKSSLDSAKLVNQDLKQKHEIYTGKGPAADELRQKLATNQNVYDSLTAVNNVLIEKNFTKDSVISELLMKSIVASLETDLTVSHGKHRLEIPDVDFKRLKRAVFLNTVYCNAGKEILNRALVLYQKIHDEPSLNDIKMIVAIFPKLLRVKLEWIKMVIPKLEQNMREMEARPQAQDIAEVKVKLPAEVINIEIKDPEANTVTINDLFALKREQEIITNALAKL